MRYEGRGESGWDWCAQTNWRGKGLEERGSARDRRGAEKVREQNSDYFFVSQILDIKIKEETEKQKEVRWFVVVVIAFCWCVVFFFLFPFSCLLCVDQSNNFNIFQKQIAWRSREKYSATQTTARRGTEVSCFFLFILFVSLYFLLFFWFHYFV